MEEQGVRQLYSKGPNIGRLSYAFLFVFYAQLNLKMLRSDRMSVTDSVGFNYIMYFSIILCSVVKHRFYSIAEFEQITIVQ